MILTAFDTLSVVMIGQFLFLIFALEVIPNANRLANRILQLILGIFGFFLLERLFIGPIADLEESFILQYGFASNILYYILGPLIYVYIRRLLIADTKAFFLGVWHFLPALIYGLFMLLHIIWFDDLLGEYYLKFFSYAWQLTCILSIAYYLSLSSRLLQNFHRSQKENLSFDQTVINYLQLMLLTILVILLVWLLNLIIGILFGPHKVAILSLMWILYGLLVYLISYYSLKYPRIFRLEIKDTSPPKALKNRLKDQEVELLKAQLNQYIHTNQAYLKPELSLSIMAQEMQTSANNISWLLNNVYQQSFYDFINQYRIEDFLKRINQKQHQDFTLMSIAEEVGFKSKSTFYKAFKAKTQQTPTEYIKAWEAQHGDAGNQSSVN